MGNKALYLQVETNNTLDQVKEAVRTAFRSVGGVMTDTPTGVTIKQGVNGVSFSFTADLSSDVNIRQVKPGSYEIECIVNWKMNALSWACLIIGIFVFGILWIVPFLYLFVNPETAYQQALHRVPTYLV